MRRIFRDYVAGKSSRAIAWALNKEGIPGPFGREWGPSTIHGNAKRGNGILNNELYIGRLVWNRQRFIKDPDTGKRVSRPNAQMEWIIREVPELRIIDQDLWEQVKARQEAMAIGPQEPSANPLARRRPKYLLAGLLKCGCCGSAYTLISKRLLGCAAARNKGTCSNRLNIRVDALEASVVSGLRTHLMDPMLFKEFCEEFTREMNRLRIERRTDRDVWQAELDRTNRDLSKLLHALKVGGSVETIMEDMKRLEARKTDLSERLAAANEPPPLLHPSMSKIYRQRVTALHERLRDQSTRLEAMEVFRQLVDQVTLVPENGELAIVLKGDLAAMLSFAADKKKPGINLRAGHSGDSGSPGSLVAGRGFGRCHHSPTAVPTTSHLDWKFDSSAP